MLTIFENMAPYIASHVYIDHSAQIIGNVRVEQDSSIWCCTVIRGDINFIHIGQRTNIQDLCMLHVTCQNPTVVGDDVTVGHHVTLHGCTIRERCLIGIGSVVLDGAEIGPDCIVGAQSLVPPGFKSTPNTLIMGVPAKTIRPLCEEELKMIAVIKTNYIEYARRHKTGRQ